MQNLIKNLRKAIVVIAISTFISIAGISSDTNQVNAQADFCTGLSQEFAGFFDCSSRFNSFTQFQGGLASPDVDGYDPSLTQAGDLKTFANNIANFVLGFLGFIAVLIIIYSGFLYVTSRGESEQMESGKKGITYALIGIIIIFSSYALVNTVLQAPGGDGTNIRQQAGMRGASNRAVGSSDFNSMAREIQLITTEMLTEYQRHQELNSRVQNLRNYQASQITSRADFIEYLEFVRNTLTDIRRNTDPLSNTRVGIDFTIQTVINPGIRQIQQRIIDERIDEFDDTVLRNNTRRFFGEIGSSTRSWWNSNFGIGDRSVRLEFECALPPEERSVNFEVTNCSFASASTNPSIIAQSITNAFALLINETIVVGIQEDYNDVIERNKNKLERQRTILQTSLRSSTGNELITNFDNAIAKINSINTSELLTANNIDTDFSNVSISLNNVSSVSTIRDLVVELQKLYNELVNLQFTVPVIIASTTQGSAPLVVTFDASQSFDPRELSIPSENFKWDVNGNGEFGNQNTSDISCTTGNSADQLSRSTVTCIFLQPGQYTPSLVVLPPESASATAQNENILPGIAYIPISVTAPTTQIQLSASVENETNPTVLRQYDDRGILQVDINQFAVTLEQARSGITFDASATQTADNRISQYAWTFSDSGLEVIGSGNGNQSQEMEIRGTGTIVGQNARTVRREFSQRGSYNVQLAVTDVDGNIDRKIFTVRITDLVARISSRNNQTTGIPGTEFIFDASGSRSDITPNLQYQWEVEDDPNNNGEDNQVIPFDQGDVEFRKRFTSPGTKTVKLVVTDGRGNREESATFVVNIESQDPTASIDTIFPDRTNQPNFVMFDASGSFDPDNPIDNPTQGLKYGWRIFNAAQGVDYDVVTGSIGSTSSAQGILVPTDANNAKLEIAFRRTGNFRIELTVEDRFGKRNITTTDINITSIVDIKFAENQVYASQISAVNGQTSATVNFSIESKNAESAQINFGDNSPVETVRFENGTANFSHNYTRAGSFEVSIRAQRGSDVNTARTLIIVGSTDSPIAIPRIRVGTTNVNNLNDLPEIYRGTQLSFDASASINLDGSNSGLRYEWEMGDGRSFNTAQIPTFSYNDLPPNDPGYFVVTLTVINQNNPSQRDSRTIQIPVVGAKPSLQALLARPQVGRNQTPINVNVEAVGAIDRDGRIVNYRFYYFPVSDPSRQRGVKNVSIPSTTLTVNTWGEQGQEIEYAFCVDLTDNEGNEIKCDEIFTSANYTRLTLTNGRNAPPRSEFQVDRTNINVGETVNFRSTSTDEDGNIIEWTYDFYGDGSFTNDRVWEQGNVSHTYTRKSDRDGFAVRLRVLDDKGAMAVSQPVRIFVDGRLSAPRAAFTEVTNDRTVQFRDRSTADTDNGGEIVEYKWNFDSTLNPDAVDSTEKNPTHTFPRSGLYNVMLTVIDNEGNESSIRRQVVVQAIGAGKTNPYSSAITASHLNLDNPSELVNEDGTPLSTDQVNLFRAYQNIIRSNPARNQDTGRITMSSNSPNLQLRFDHLPRDTRRILIDQNIYFDSDGDGVRNNDIDIERFDLEPITIQYPASQQSRPIRILVAVETARGEIFIDQADVVFPGLNFQANLNFRLTDNIPALTYLLFLITILVVGPYAISRKSQKIKKKIKI